MEIACVSSFFSKLPLHMKLIVKFGTMDFNNCSDPICNYRCSLVYVARFKLGVWFRIVEHYFNLNLFAFNVVVARLRTSVFNYTRAIKIHSLPIVLVKPKRLFMSLEFIIHCTLKSLNWLCSRFLDGSDIKINMQTTMRHVMLFFLNQSWIFCLNCKFTDPDSSQVVTRFQFWGLFVNQIWIKPVFGGGSH